MTDSEAISLVARALEQVTAEEWVSLPTLAKQYDTSNKTVKAWIFDMIAKGEKITTCRPGATWRINRREFDKAFRKHYSKQFLPAL
jgi:hypothetical protein